MKQRVVFLDRDGVINRDSSEYIKNWQEFHFLPGSIDALRRLTNAGFLNILITNQSAVNRGLISRQTLAEIHSHMLRALKRKGAEITDIFFCPHRPEENCPCRKPKPGLIRQAQQIYKIDLGTAVMVGDNLKDIVCARQAGCRYAVLVRSGIHKDVEKELAAADVDADWVTKDLSAAVEWIIETQTG